NVARDRLQQQLDDRLPRADRPPTAVPGADRRGDPERLGLLSSELRVDPISGRQVVIAPRRAHRPGAGYALIEPPTQKELDECPFCRGREDRTPPETLRLPDGAENWIVRVVPNLYPAIERQEVVIHSPEHKRSFAELTDEEIDLVEQAWLRRASAGLEE